MDQTRFLVRDHPTLGPDVRQFKLECAHGRTFGLVRAGSKPIADQVVLDLLRLRHQRENECRCATALRLGTAVAPQRPSSTGHPLPRIDRARLLEKGTTHDLVQ